MVQKKSKKIDKADFPYICKKGDHRKKKNSTNSPCPSKSRFPFGDAQKRYRSSVPTAAKKAIPRCNRFRTPMSPLVISLLYDLCFRFNDFVTHDRDEKKTFSEV